MAAASGLGGQSYWRQPSAVTLPAHVCPIPVEKTLSQKSGGGGIQLKIVQKTYVNIPFRWMWDGYLERFLANELNPEIGIDAAALDRYPISDFQHIADQIHSKGLSTTLHAPFFDLSAGSLDPEIRGVTRRRFNELLRLVPIFKPKSVVCHAGYDWKRYGYGRNEWVAHSLEMWSWLADQLRSNDSLLMLENVYEREPEEILILFENLVDYRVGFCLDIGHQSAFSQTPWNGWLEQLAPYLGQLHLHDNHGLRDDHIALGQGSIDFKSFFAILHALRQTPPIVTLEPHTEAALWPSLQYLESVWPW